jgi:hypothetical protein
VGILIPGRKLFDLGFAVVDSAVLVILGEEEAALEKTECRGGGKKGRSFTNPILFRFCVLRIKKI